MRIKFEKSNTAFRTVNGRDVSDEEWENGLSLRENKNPFVMRGGDEMKNEDPFQEFHDDEKKV